MRRLIGIRLLAIMIAVAAVMSPAFGATRHIVMLFDERPELPGLAAIDAEFVRTLTAGSDDRIEIYRESMDLSRFAANDYDGFLLEKLREKYASKKIDVILAVLGPSLDFLLRHGDAIFPGVPIIFCGFDRWELGDRQLPPRVSGVFLKREFAPTLDAVLHIHPDTQRAVVVAGVTDFDTRLVEQMRTEFQRYEQRLAFTYLNGRTLQDILAIVGELPQNTVVLFSTFFRDPSGQSFIPHDLVPTISAASNAPVYGFVDQYLGRGVVGGSFYSLSTQGSEAAKKVRVVLAGEEPEPRFADVRLTKRIFDWRQMQRWGVSESRLPAGSEIRFREPSLWDRYWREVLVALGVIALQLGLIFWLIYEHRRRQAAEAESLQRVNELARVNRFATAGALSASIAHEIRQPLSAMLAYADAALGYLRQKSPKLDQLQSLLDDMVRETHRANAIVGRVRAMFKGDVQAWTEFDLNDLIRETVKLAGGSIEANNIDVDMRLNPRCPPVSGDRTQIQQVLVNLITNAIEAMSNAAEPPRVLGLHSGLGVDSVVLTVSDTGPIIDPSVAGKMFEPLFTTKSSGMGIGLSLSRSIIAAHDGTLTVEPRQPRGMEFRLALPSAKAHAGSRTGTGQVV